MAMLPCRAGIKPDTDGDDRLWIVIGSSQVTFKVSWRGKRISDKALKKQLEKLQRIFGVVRETA